MLEELFMKINHQALNKNRMSKSFLNRLRIVY